MLCSLVLVVNVMHFFMYITLVPLLDFISLMQLLCVVVSIECWTCKWYFALSLLACISRRSFLVWMIIVVTIYSDCSFLVKSCFIALFYICLRLFYVYCVLYLCFVAYYLLINVMHFLYVHQSCALCWILYPWCNYFEFLYRLSVGHANDILHWAY